MAHNMRKTILHTRVLIAEDLGAAPTTLVLARVECYTKERSQPTPRRGGEVRSQHVGGGCCASSRPIP